MVSLLFVMVTLGVQVYISDLGDAHQLLKGTIPLRDGVNASSAPIWDALFAKGTMPLHLL